MPSILRRSCVSEYIHVYTYIHTYIQVIVEAIHPEAELCIGIAYPSVLDNFRVIPEAKHAHMGYVNNGDLVAVSAHMCVCVRVCSWFYMR